MPSSRQLHTIAEGMVFFQKKKKEVFVRGRFLVFLFGFNVIIKSCKRILPTKKRNKKSKQNKTPKGHETDLPKNNDVVLQKVNNEEDQWHYIRELQDKYSL